jgi:hypothetical protein
VELRKINAPAGHAPFGPALPNGKQAYVTAPSSRKRSTRARPVQVGREEGLYSGKRQGSKARGIGVAVSPTRAARSASMVYSSSSPMAASSSSLASAIWGTHSALTFTGRRRRCSTCRGTGDVVFGNTTKNLPWTCVWRAADGARDDARRAAAVRAIRAQEIGEDARRRQPKA